MTSGKRLVIAKGKGYLSAAGPQARFVVFLIIVLIAFTLLLRVFQKLADILDLPLFLPISLVTLFIFIGIVGTLYSHRFLGPMVRIRRAIEHMTQGDLSISLRLRDSDDAMLKDLASALSQLCEHYRNSHTLIQDAATDLFNDIQAAREKIRGGAAKGDLQAQVDRIREKQELLERAIKTLRKA